jgi:hypothetical protein
VIDETGAMPGAGAIPDLLYPSGPGWAAYRLPCPGANGFVTPRAAGVVAEGEPAAGAIPPAGNPAGPSQPPATPPVTPPPGATPDSDGLTTDAGRRALDAERTKAKAAEDRAKAAEKERDDLKAATQSDGEKAITAAKKEAEATTSAKFESRLRQAEVRSALRTAGLTNDKTLALAVNAAEFAALKVEEDGSIRDLDKVVEAFKKDYPEMVAAVAPKPPTGGQPTRGPQNGGAPERPKTLNEAVAAHYAGQPGARPA